MHPRPTGRQVLAFLVVAGLTAGCASSDNGPTGGNNYTISISLSNPALSVQDGSSGSETLTLTRGGGYTGAVTLTVQGAPSGVTVSPSPSNLASGSSSASVAVSVGAAVPAGSYSITVTASGSGVANATATLSLTVTAVANPAFALAIAPTSLSLMTGGNGTATVTVTRSGGFSGTVNLTVSGAPTNVTASLNPTSVTGTSATLTVNVGATAAAGDYTLTITGTGTGVSDQTVTLALTITASSAGDFSLSVNPASLSIASGSSDMATVTVDRTGGFSGAVTLAVTGMPTGMTATPNPASVSGGSSTLSVVVGASVAAGTYPLTITGSATGLSDETTTLTVAVTSTGGSGNVTWTFCTATGLPDWVAFQDGSGPWMHVTSSTNTYSFNISSANGAIAYVTHDGSGDYTTNLVYATQAELTTVGAGQCTGSSASTRTIHGSVAGLGATDLANITMGGIPAMVLGVGPNTFSLQNVPSGPRDLIAARAALNTSGGGFSTMVNKLIFRRDLDPADGATLPVLDFGGAEAFDPESHTVSIQNLGSLQATASLSYYTANGSAGQFYSALTDAGATGTYVVPEVPAAHQAAGDLHMLTVTANPPAASQDNLRSVITMFTAPADKTVTIGPNMNTTTVTTAATTPYARLRAQYAVQPEYNSFLVFAYGPNSGGSPGVNTLVTGAYLGGNTAFDFTTPDFSGVAGWNNAWGAMTGVQTSWVLTASGWSVSGGILASPFQDGATTLSALRVGSIVP